MRRVVIYPDAESVATATAARLLITLGDTLATQDRADVVVTGGTVGIATLKAVAASPLAGTINWSSVHIWWGDERFVPTGDSDRNEVQAQTAMLGKLPIPEENVHRWGASDEFDGAELAALAYRKQMADHDDPHWDVLLLGLGPDGHVASLFPNHPDYEDAFDAQVCAVHDSPKPPPTRVSLGLASINRARQVWVVAAGENKADAVKGCLGGDGRLPGANVAGVDATLWLVDVAAAQTAAPRR